MSNFLDEQNIESGSLTMRLLWSFLYVLVWWAIETVVVLLAFAQAVFCIVSGNPNEQLQIFGKQIAEFAKQIVKYITFASNERPFPFSEWPNA